MHTVAVVDDNADNRLIIRTILEDQYEILEYSSGIEAIQGFKKSKPDVVILDISLPEMDGTEILRRIRDDPELHDLPVVALTAHAMVGDREKYLAAGFNDYVAHQGHLFGFDNNVFACVDLETGKKKWKAECL